MEEKEALGKEESELYEHFRFVADPKQSKVRLDKFLMDRLPQAVSRNRVQSAIKSEAILVNEKVVKSNYKIRPHDVVTITLDQPPREFELLKEDIPLDIRYEDDEVMIVHKPPGMVVHPGVGVWSGTLVNGLAHYFSKLDLPVKDGNDNDRPGLVHRIDKETSGLLVIAKTPEAMTHLSKQFFKHTTERKYLALVWGEPDEDEGTIESYLGRDPGNPMLRKVYDEDQEGGKHAITHYKVLERLYYVSLIECQLETGRTHQIRVHMKHLGNPLFNDKRYGGDRIVKGTVFTKYRQYVENCFKMLPRQALHATSLGFIHPKTGEKMDFVADLPEDFQSVLNKWRGYVAGRKEIMKHEKND